MRDPERQGILIIDTSYYSGFSVSVVNNLSSTSLSFSGSEPNFSRIWDLIDIALNSSKVTKNDVSVLAVSRGPGPFSAVRTGIAIAKTLKEIKSIPVIMFSMFEVLARQFENSYFFVDGRAKKLIVGDSFGNIHLLKVDQLQTFVSESESTFGMAKFVAVGCQSVINGLLIDGLISKSVYDKFIFYDILPTTWIREVVLKKYELGEFDDKLEPIYLSL